MERLRCREAVIARNAAFVSSTRLGAAAVDEEDSWRAALGPLREADFILAGAAKD